MVKMKLYATGFLLFAIVANAAIVPNTADADTKGKCPPLPQSVCSCYEQALHVVCEGLTADALKNFELEKKYEVNTLIIRNSPDFPDVFERSLAENLKAQSLILHLDTKTTPTNNVEMILPIAIHSLEIVLNKDSTLSVGDLQPSLTSLSISKVKMLKHFNLLKLDNLVDLELNDVDFEETNLPMQKTKLKRVKITGTKELKGVAFYDPVNECKETDPQVRIELINNEGLTSFDIAKLFEGKGAKCYYFVNLSGNKNLDPKLLTNQIKKDSFKTIEPKKLYLVLYGKDFECNQCVTSFYEARAAFIHSLKCSEPNKYIDLLSSEDKGKLKACTS